MSESGMNWITIVLVAPLVWSISSIIDQYLCRRYFKENIFFAFFFFGCTNIPFIAGIVLYAPSVLDTPPLLALTLFCGGLLYMACIYPYFKALQEDDASIAIPIFQTIPVFTFIFGFFFLGETLQTSQIIAGLVIVLASVGIAWDHATNTLRVKTLLYMLCASVLFASYTIFLRHFAKDIHWLTITFWTLTSWSVTGIIGLIFSKSARQFIWRISKESKGQVLVFGGIQEGLDIIATGTWIIGLSLAPTAVHVTLVNGTQPFITLIVAGLAGFFWPKYYTALKFGKALTIKFILCSIMFCALYILTQTP